jgi:hypothetical protein
MRYLADLGVTALLLTAPYDNREISGQALDCDDTRLYGPPRLVSGGQQADGNVMLPVRSFLVLR